MSRTTLNLGILAHVDAGKTTLTERLLYAAGVIEAVGNVDKGTTQTDWLPLERERGITIKSAVVSFSLHGTVVNLIDTPGHPDFIAEVERALDVLDGIVLVVSAVEGVQPQTRLLMRVLQRLKLPTLLFVNKIDRPGADPDAVVAGIRRRLTASVAPLCAVRRAGGRAADTVAFGEDDQTFRDSLASLLAEHDDFVLGAVAEGRTIPYPRVRGELARQTRAALVHPVLFGSAITGAGVPALAAAITELLPARTPDPAGPAHGTVFKIERGAAGDKLAYVHLTEGTLRRRDRVALSPRGDDKVTGIAVFAGGSLVEQAALTAGQIGKVRGLRSVRVGDTLGPAPRRGPARFAPPTLATRVVPDTPSDGPRLVAALTDLAEQDPLIGVRHDARSGEISVSLYGEVQKEVIQATLHRDYGVGASFRAVTPLYVEHPAGTGEAVEVMHGPANPFDATIGFRVEPGPPGSGLELRLDVDPSTVPLFLFKTIERFAAHVEQWVCDTLAQGLRGWAVGECVVTMHRCLYGVADGPPSRRGASTPTDFRLLTPIVAMEALRAAGTIVCEPMTAASLEVPSEHVQSVLTALGRLGASVEDVRAKEELTFLRAVLTAEAALGLQRALPALTSGEGVLDGAFGGYRPVPGRPPRRRRTGVDPLDRASYLKSLGRHV